MLPLTPKHKVKRDMEYIIYCDESVTDGKYYSDFFGGVLVRSGDFDEIPYPLDQRDAFKAHILSLQKFWQFRKARLKIRLDDIAEINSKKHTIQQCMDIVLGAMAFVLNKKHLETAPGTNERGKRTIAKEKLFNHIIELIKESNGCEVFYICETTPSKSPKDYWITPYRHWKFLPAEFKDQKCI